jgi:hypothetical protein
MPGLLEKGSIENRKSSGADPSPRRLTKARRRDSGRHVARDAIMEILIRVHPL